MKVLSEAAMLNLEADIPALATGAIRQAYAQALTSHGRVIEAVNGELVEFTVEGQSRVLKTLPNPTRVAVGLKRIRRANSSGNGSDPITN
jgi:hypothetical protein